VFAVATVVAAVCAYRAQADQLQAQRELNEKQTPVLELQATELQKSLDERKREARERRRAQASQVYIWEDRFDPALSGRIAAHIKNARQLPVHTAEFSWRYLDESHHSTLHPAPLMPGEQWDDTTDFPSDADMEEFVAVAIFRDHAGIPWCARQDGRLEELPQRPSSPPANPARSWKSKYFDDKPTATFDSPSL
jgi:hypothetical protein